MRRWIFGALGERERNFGVRLLEKKVDHRERRIMTCRLLLLLSIFAAGAFARAADTSGKSK
jgi:hypothetical protein